jgi:hypothetical protein
VIRLSFLSLALVLVPGALLCVCAYLILKGRRTRKFNPIERLREEQARYLPRNPARDEAQKELARAQKRLGKPVGLTCAETLGAMQRKHDAPERHCLYPACSEKHAEDSGFCGGHRALMRDGALCCPHCGDALCMGGPQRGTCPACLCTPGTDEPSAPEEGHGMPAGWKWDADGYYYKMIGADPAIGPDCTYSFWSPPEDKADEFAQRFWSGLGEAFTASSGTAGTTLTVNDEGEVSDAEWDEIMAKLPDGAQVVSVGPRLCAVCPVGRVVRWSKPENAWLLTDYATATAARAALGLAT